MSATRLIHQEDINRYISSIDEDENVDSTSDSETNYDIISNGNSRNSFIYSYGCKKLISSVAYLP